MYSIMMYHDVSRFTVLIPSNTVLPCLPPICLAVSGADQRHPWNRMREPELNERVTNETLPRHGPDDGRSNAIGQC